MTLEHPLILLLAPVAAAVIVLSLRGRGYSAGRIVLLVLLRGLLAAAVILAVAGTTVRLPTPERTVVFLIDYSPSAKDRLATARDLVLDRLARLSPDDSPVVLGFSSVVFPIDLKRDEAGRPRLVPPAVIPGGPATDVAAALDAALVRIPAGHPGVIYLLSDGIETEGDMRAAALRVSARRIPVFIPRPSPEPPADVRVAALTAPDLVDRSRPFRLTCRIEATRALSAQVEVTRDGNLVARRSVDLTPEMPAELDFVERLDGEGLHLYAAHVAAAGDRFSENNDLTVPVEVRGRPLVLYISGFPGATPVERLFASLPEFRFKRIADGRWLTPDVLADASVIMLDSAPYEALGAKGREIVTSVADSGCGLVMLGGPGSFGVGGYSDTPIDAVLPVHCDPRDADKRPLALVVALDSSGSMGEGGGKKMEMARAATMLTLARLTPTDALAVIVFRVTPDVVIPLGPVGEITGPERRLAAVVPGGGTNMFPALDLALATLKDVKAPLRHVVLLSDGLSLPGDVDGVIARYHAAGVSLSALATGADADRKTLAKFASGTGGRFYEARDIDKLPQFFLDDLRRVDGPLVREGAAFKLDAAGADLLGGINTSALPTVLAYNRTRLRERATLVLDHKFEENPEPVLAARRAGLGRSVALTASFDAKWTGELAAWPEWPKLMVNLVRFAERTERTEAFDLSVKREGNRFGVTVEAKPTAAEQDVAKVRLADLSGRAVDVPVERTGPRTWSGGVEASLEGVVLATLVGQTPAGEAAVLTRYVPATYPREFADFTPRFDKLEEVVRITGGRVAETLSDFRVAGGPAPTRKADMTLWLIGAALLLFMLELIGRAAGKL